LRRYTEEEQLRRVVEDTEKIVAAMVWPSLNPKPETLNTKP
jgi:hypothetical protein